MLKCPAGGAFLIGYPKMTWIEGMKKKMGCKASNAADRFLFAP